MLPIPDPYHPLIAHGNVSAVGRAERHGVCRPKLATGGALVVKHLLTGRQVPNFDSPVGAGRGQVLAVGVESNADDRIGMRPRKRLNLFARLAVPDLDRAVSARGGE